MVHSDNLDDDAVLKKYTDFDWKTHTSYNILNFWEANNLEFPSLFSIALRIFSTLSSSAELEQLFSILKNILNDQRARLNPETISKVNLAKHAN